jgi:hypothetical protein
MRLASKYGVWLAVLLLAAALPGAASRFGGRRHDPCRAPEALRATSLIPDTTALGERRESLTPATFQWSEGTVPNPAFPDHPLVFQLVRSYDGTKLYERPVSFAREKLEPERREVREVATSLGTIPVHVVWDHTSSPSTLVAYFFVFDEDVVRSAFLAQLRAAIDLALTGPRPVTLVLISGVAAPQAAPAVERAATEWLARAWPFVADACRPR